MSYDARIILGGRSPDIVNALAVSEQGRQQRLDNQNQNAMRDMLKTQGAGIMAGDQNALARLAQYDPSAALGIQTQRQDMAYNDKRLSVLGEQEKRAAAEYAAGLSAQQRAAEAAQIEGTIKQALAAPTPQAFDAMMIEMGRQDMVGQFDNRQALAAPFMEIADILKMGETPAPLSPEGKLAADMAAGIVPQGTVSTPDTVVNVGGEGDEFYKELDKKNAAMFSTLQDEGVQAGRTIGLIDRLDALMQNTPTGGVAAFTRLAGEVGIDIGGLGDVQAVNALINQIVPQQRQPGSGPMSDADLALFKQSVPRLINTPEGNAIIVQTMRGINQYVLQQAEIADMVANREITPAEARKRLKALANPLDGFNAGSAGEAPAPTGGTPKRMKYNPETGEIE